MTEVRVQRVKDPAQETLPIFADLAQRFDAVRQRAHELFEGRSDEMARALQDWFTAEHEILGGAPAKLSEKDSAYVIEFNLAGFDAKDVHVTATPVEIIVRAAKEDERKVENEKVLWSEFGSRDVCRRFEFPSSIDTEKVTATLDKGALYVRAPKASAVKEKTIEVATAA